MAKFPQPPGIAALVKISPQTIIYKKGTLVWRLHYTGNAYPTRWDEFRYFGPTTGRFDHHQRNSQDQAYTQDRGIMYLAIDGPTCIAEVFQMTRVIDRQSGTPCLAGFQLQQAVTLLDLTGTFVTKLGASTVIHSGARPRAQRWAQQLYEAYPQIDGILYCSSMYGNAPAIALFERALPAIPQYCKFHRSLNDPAMLAILAATAERIHYVLV